MNLVITRDVRGQLLIEIVQGKDLVARDISTGKSDPYVVLEVGSESQQTKHIPKTLFPEWNESFTFNVSRVRVPPPSKL